jgi:histidyl-tRNA synthetase
MITEAECLKVADRILSSLNLGDFEIRVNHRVLLEGMFALAGINPNDFKTVCSSVDKLDKVPWDEVKKELINEKNIDEAAADKLEQYVRARGNRQLLYFNFILLLELVAGANNERLFEFFEQIQDERITKAIKELRVLMDYCALYNCDKSVVFEPSLARGLDYYTGTIYEAVITSK